MNQKRIRRRGKRQDCKTAKKERRCYITGEPLPREKMIRFVVGPERMVYPDLTEKMNGYGIWLTADSEIIRTVMTKKIFSKAFHADVRPVPDIVTLIDLQLRERCMTLLGLANKAGIVVAGFDKIAKMKEKPALLIEAADGSVDNEGKLEKKYPDAVVYTDFSSEELGKALGRDVCVHIAVMSGKMAENLQREIMRYRYFSQQEKGSVQNDE